MKQKAIALAIAAAISSNLVGCAALSRPEPTPAIQFTYAAENGPAIGLVRAFVMNGNTVLQFVDIPQAQPKVYAGDQPAPLPYQIIGQYAVLSGIHPSLRVVANGATATVTAKSVEPALKLKMSPELAYPGESSQSPPTNDPLQRESQDVAQLRNEVAELKRKLAGDPNAGAGTNIPAAIVRAETKTTALIVPAGDTSRTWTLTANRTLKDNLADLVQQAGYTFVWKASNPYMVTYTKKYQGTFQEVIGEIAQEVPTLDVRLYAGKRRMDVVDATE